MASVSPDEALGGAAGALEGAEGDSGAERLFLHLVYRLHSALDSAEILRRFDRFMAERLDYDGLEYKAAKVARDEPRFQRGPCDGRRYGCRLRLPGAEIGEIRFYRRAKFTAAEREMLRRLSAALLHPLRNGMLYRQAVNSAERDPLTGIANRAAMDKALEREIEMSRRASSPLSVIILDIDDLKSVNDGHGHGGGDAALKTVARGMATQIRRGDGLYRYGGDEFLLLLRNTGVQGAAQLAERVRAAVERLFEPRREETPRVTVSAGVTALRANEDPLQLLRRCDGLLYAAKKAGGNRVMTAGL